MKQIRIISIALVLLMMPLFPACSRVFSGESTLIFPSGTIIRAEVADTPETRERGLMFRDHLPKGGGLLFTFEVEKPYAFWMKNCKFPIDIIWMNSAKKIVYISRDTPPCTADPCPTYGPKDKKALYVLEVAAGFAKKENLKPGVVIQF